MADAGALPVQSETQSHLFKKEPPVAIEVENMYEKKSSPKHYTIVRELLKGKKISAETLSEKIGAPLSNRMMGLIIERLGNDGNVEVERTRDQANGTEYRAFVSTTPKKAVKKAGQRPLSAPVESAALRIASTAIQSAKVTTEAPTAKPAKKGKGRAIATKKGGLKRG